MNCTVCGILQAQNTKILEWAAVPFSRRSSQPRDLTQVSFVSYFGRQVLYHWAPWESHIEAFATNSPLSQQEHFTFFLFPVES